MSFINLWEDIKFTKFLIDLNDAHTLRRKLFCPVTIKTEITNAQHEPLRYAVENGRTDIVRLFVDCGANVSLKFPMLDVDHNYLYTYLHLLACSREDLQINEIANILIAHGADVNAVTEPLPRNPLLTFQWDDPKKLELHKRSPVQISIKNGNIPFTELLLNNGARLDDGPEWNLGGPLSFLVLAPKIKQTEMLLLLINHGMKPAVRNGVPTVHFLHYLIKTSFLRDIDILEISKILVESGLAWVVEDYPVQSPILNAAVELGDVDLIKFLVESGADINKKSSLTGNFPLLTAISRERDAELIEYLLSHDANVNEKNLDGETALQVACTHRCEKIIRLLLQKGADFNAVDNITNETPFSLLDPHQYDENNAACVDLMVKEMAKRKFLDDLAVSEMNMDLVQSFPECQKLYQRCVNELKQLSSTEFYGSHTYTSVMKLSKTDEKTLAELVINQDFVEKYEENLNKFPIYEKDLRNILKEAIKDKDKLEAAIKVKEEPEADIKVKEEPGTDIRGKEEPEADIKVKEEPGADIRGKEEPGADIKVKEEPGADIRGKEEPGADIRSKEELEASIKVKEEPGTDVRGKEEPGTDIRGKEEPGTDIKVKEEPGTDIRGKEEPGTDIRVKEEPESIE